MSKYLVVVDMQKDFMSSIVSEGQMAGNFSLI